MKVVVLPERSCMFFVTENCVAMGGSALSTAVNPWVQFEKKIKKGVVFVVFFGFYMFVCCLP
tara:strand:- start:79 stop:264 length:186 start_codon:yes stop_codon:yes gene_type:complete